MYVYLVIKSIIDCTMDAFTTFCNFINNNEECDDDTAAFKTYFDAYSNYLVSKKYQMNDIKRYRMNSIIDYFIQHKKPDINKQELYNHYHKHVKDNFNMTLNPPKNLLYEQEKQEYEDKKMEEFINDTDDVQQHYRDYLNRCQYLAQVGLYCSNKQEDNDIEYLSDSDESYYSDNYSSYDDYEYDDVYDNYDYFEEPLSDEEY